MREKAKKRPKRTRTLKPRKASPTYSPKSKDPGQVWAMIESVIETNCATMGKYYDPDTKTHCILGGLAARVKIPLPPKGSNDRGILYGRLESFKKQLLKAYPVLDEHDLESLQQVNDRYSDLSTRRRNLHETVQSWKGAVTFEPK